MAPIVRLSETTLEKAVSAAAAVLFNGGIIAIPTDTLYGLVCTLNNFDKLYTIKRRSLLKPLGLLISDIDNIKKWCAHCPDDYVLHRLLPGPVTLLFPRLPALPPNFNPGHKSVGIRIPKNEFVTKLTKRFEYLKEMSKNVKVSISRFYYKDFRELWPKIDLIIDGGQILDADGNICRSGSTVVNLCNSGTYSIVRDGIARAATEFVLRDCGLIGATDGD
uniref:Threonylcarbamoyl-AMP synthase n=1 Tax=Syphacia muris TaxID=451379 RepID=A0A0N5AZ83_9BILA